jgi:6,7-dimethyl-8-ribityllumazine synthase
MARTNFTSRKTVARSKPLSGKQATPAIVVAEFNSLVTERLLKGCLTDLARRGIKGVRVVRVPGAFELPLAAKVLAASGRYDAVIALGCIIRGETPHDRYIAAETARGLGQAALDTGVPVVFGVLTTLDLPQALARAGRHNKGAEAAQTAVRMVEVMADVNGRRK